MVFDILESLTPNFSYPLTEIAIRCFFLAHPKYELSFYYMTLCNYNIITPRLLKDTLNGNCHTVMIAHISPADRHRDESRNTLVYADRAKNISNKVVTSTSY